MIFTKRALTGWNLNVSSSSDFHSSTYLPRRSKCRQCRSRLPKHQSCKRGSCPSKSDFYCLQRLGPIQDYIESTRRRPRPAKRFSGCRRRQCGSGFGLFVSGHNGAMEKARSERESAMAAHRSVCGNFNADEAPGWIGNGVRDGDTLETCVNGSDTFGGGNVHRPRGKVIGEFHRVDDTRS